MSPSARASATVLALLTAAAVVTTGSLSSSAADVAGFTAYDTQIGSSPSAPWTTSAPSDIAVLASAGRGDVVQLSAAPGASTDLMHLVSSGTFAPLDGYLAKTLPSNLYTGASTDDDVPATSGPSFAARVTSGAPELYFDFLWQYSDTATTTAEAVISCRVDLDFPLTASWRTIAWSPICPLYVPQSDITAVGPWGGGGNYTAGTTYRSFNDGNPSAIPLLNTGGPRVTAVTGIGFHIVNTGAEPASVELDSVTVRDFSLDFAAATAPSAVAQPTLSAPGANALTVTWAAPTTHGTPVTGYTVSLLRGGTSVDQQVAADATSATFTGLQAGSYTASVVATSARGSAAASVPSAARVIAAAQQTTVTTSTSPAAVSVLGTAVTVTATVAPGSAPGTIAIFDGATKLGEGPAVSGAFSVTTSALAKGDHSLTATFTPTDSLAFTPSTSQAAAFEVTVKEAPAPAPAGSTQTLLAAVDADDIKQSTDSFTGSGQALGALDASKPLTGELPWSSPDSFVDVYVYSTPVFVGTFPVVNGKVILSGAALPSLAAGTHHLAFVGQSSGALQVLQVQVVPAAAGLANTGSTVTAPLVLSGLLLLVGAGIVLIARRRRTA